MAKIIIKRKSGLSGCMVKHKVYLSNTFVGELKNGGSLEISVDVGTYLLSFNSNMKKSASSSTFKITVSRQSEIIELQTRFDSSGEYKVEYTDYRPLDKASINEQIALAQHDGSFYSGNSNSKAETQAYGICCPKCGSYDVMPVSEVETKEKDFASGKACCGYLLIGPLGLLCGLIGRGKKTKTTTYWMCKSCDNKFQI